ncbi:hypothetical protein [Circular ssDNA virus sp.]|uniref:hypothetical protein n=1 Tax=Circular ssDNA virus sp. TaxID=2805939 RepID=UPI0007F99FD6|nr:hypothetical protein [Circular ssDNA virus sp.]ANN22662.1 hypothetical protein [Circular ssDNA virus sp.]
MSLDGDHCGECGSDPCSCVVQDEPKTPAGKRPLSASQYIDVDAEDGSQPESIEGEEEDEVLEHHKGYHKTFEKKLRCDERYSPEADLDAYFDEFGLSAESRIAMCRTYANYLTQKLRSSGRLGPARPKKLGQKTDTQRRLTWK